MLKVRGLEKRYGDRQALANLSFSLPPGCFAMLLGPNGAGKSTLFQILTGLFAPDAGEIEVAGHVLRDEPIQALRSMGVVFQQISLDLDLSVLRNLRLHADLHGIARKMADERINEGCALLDLEDMLDRPTRALSGGQRRKVELVRALLHRPLLLLMDEPTVGLDPKSRRDLLAALREDVRQRRSSVLWATHLVEETAYADRVLLLHRGRMLADGTPEEVTRALGGRSLEHGFLEATA
ncbi:ATP-binding cassette domain-containing protein [Ramlibacter sp. 2FC]|uniref:ATP-binding cassette domain-containing protein n=1 Tax=Ramlibacter sp. 2FC TaxID=2502188 RepID=UPI0010F720FA|nr:ATP-binding cassette domain-containing protein [Ramlibacter sp. 2FC]